MVNWHKFFTSILDTISDGVFISDAMGTMIHGVITEGIKAG